MRDILSDKEAPARVMRAMVDEVHRHADLARSVYPDALDRGTYQGKRLAEVFAATSERDLAAFWDYVVSDPWSYISYDFKLVDIYATWLVRGTPGTVVRAEARHQRAGRARADVTLGG